MTLAQNLENVTTRLKVAADSPVDRGISPVFLINDEIELIDPRHLAEWCDRNNLSKRAFIDRANSYRTSMGREPGRGYVLVTKTVLDTLGDTIDLTIREIQRTDPPAPSLTIKNLRIDRAEAIHPTYDPGAISGSKTIGSTVYLLHLVDQRDFAASHTTIAQSYNVKINANTDQVAYQKSPSFTPWTVRELIEDLTGKLGWTVAFMDEDLSILDFAPEGFRFLGENTYEALLSVLDAFSLNLSIAHDGTAWIIPPSLGDTSEFEDALTDLNARRLISFKAFDEPAIKPSKVRVFFPNRDFQMQNTWGFVGNEFPLIFSPEEMLKGYPFAVYEHDSGETNSRIHHKWAPIWRETDSAGGDNDPLLATVGDTIGANHVDMIGQWDSWRQFIYSGVVDYEPRGPFNGVAWYDFGSGMHTKLFLMPPAMLDHISLREFSSEDWIEDVREELGDLTDKYPSPPDVTRKHQATPRVMFGVVGSQTIPVGEVGECSLYSGNVAGNMVTWTPGIMVDAIAYFEDLTPGSRILLLYDWQLGSGGRWVAVGFGAQSSQQTLGVLACANADAPFDSTTPTVPITNLQIISPDPFSQPWSGVTEAANKFGLAGCSQGNLLLAYDRNNPSQPIITQVDWTETKFGTKLSREADMCQLDLEKNRALTPCWDSDDPIKEGIAFNTIKVVAEEDMGAGTAITFNNQTCDLEYRRREICVFENALSSGEEATQTVVNLKNIREGCFPIRTCCPCICADLQGSMDYIFTPAGQRPGDPVDAGDPCWQGACHPGIFNVTRQLVENLGGVGPECDALLGPGTCERYWEANFSCPGGGTPNTYRITLCCRDNEFVEPLVLCWEDSGDTFDEKLWNRVDDNPNNCSCAIFEIDLDLGGNADWCGCAPNANCLIWLWIDLDGNGFDAC